MEFDSNRKFWEKTAKFYAPIQERSNKALYEAVVMHSKAYIKKDSKVLELACGSGQITLPLYKLAGVWEATDYCPRMLEEARKRTSEVNFSVQDATALSYDDESFNIVIIANALHIMPEPEKALTEIHRVLKPGGIILAPTFVYEGKYNRLRMKLTTMLGFKSYGEWTLNGLGEFVEGAGFKLTEKSLLPGSPLPEGFVAAEKL